MTYNNQIILKSFRSDPEEKEVFHHNKYIGRIYAIRGGEFRTERKVKFAKYNGFGVPTVIFEDERLIFNRVSIRYEKVWFTVSREILLRFGKIETYPEGNKIYLNIKYFQRDDDTQFEFLFGRSEDSR
jgi:hypothetical protein